ncbi:uncharacterized protein LOC6037292 [Culex quinquefasciatus]|uniref:uncharacterized protein LOC6037292 n=1 Tax=Culex quinquefasciatus TaxID=7176 RepID=UPI0018E296BC|nr:uncharacterized protein LOC6037292 [Culex quinquefasciatus]
MRNKVAPEEPSKIPQVFLVETVETSQPRSSQRSTSPTCDKSACQSGLEPLLRSRAILYRERRECSCCTSPTYEIIDEQDQVLYEVRELDGFCCCGPNVALAANAYGSMVLHFRMDQYCDGCFLAPYKGISVSDATGRLLGSVEMQFWSLKNRFDVLDSDGRLLFKVTNRTKFCGAQTFYVHDRERKMAGRILQEGMGFCYKIEYFQGLDLTARVTLIAATKFIIYQLKAARSSH